MIITEPVNRTMQRIIDGVRTISRVEHDLRDGECHLTSGTRIEPREVEYTDGRRFRRYGNEKEFHTEEFRRYLDPRSVVI